MKQKLLTLLAAVLLGSISAFAQNTNPVKGDVNEDGTVDVADIVNVIKIMNEGGGAVGEKTCYWYAGTNNGNAVTADNFTDVASRIAESEVPETGSVTANGQYVYFVMPKTKHLESLTDGNSSAVEFTCTEAMGYLIYRTNDKINGSVNYNVEQTVYYWYIGPTDPSTLDENTDLSSIQVNNNDMTSPGWRYIGNTVPTYSSSNMLWNGGQNHISFGGRTEYYIALPNNSLKLYNSAGDNEMDGCTSMGTKTIDGVTYYIYKRNVKAAAFGFNIY